jgi:hypothetical protein
MLDPQQLTAIKISAQREEWSAVGDALRVLSAQAAGNPVDVLRVKSLVRVIQERNREDLCGAVDELLRIQNRLDSQ